MLAGLTSRWTSPARWAASRASATWAARPAACHGSSGVGSSSRCAQRLARHQLHHDGLDAGVRAGVVDRHDRRGGRGGRRRRPPGGTGRRSCRRRRGGGGAASPRPGGAAPRRVPSHTWAMPPDGDQLLEAVAAAEQPPGLDERARAGAAVTGVPRGGVGIDTARRGYPARRGRARSGDGSGRPGDADDPRARRGCR